MWRRVSEATVDTDAYCFFKGREAKDSFITPLRWDVTTWRRHSHPANEIMVTHFWDGDGEPTAFPGDGQ
jgi:hypothetical protein